MRDEYVPSAFPIWTGSTIDSDSGMTLRDYFAGQALLALISSENDTDMGKFARVSYGFADAMLEMRKE